MRYYFLILFLPLFLFAEQYDWPSWRGPQRDSISPETQWNPKALNNKKILWQTNVGQGYSAVAILGNRLYTMGNKKRKDIIFCLDANTGMEIWTYSYDCPSGSYPGPRTSPVIEDGYVYTLSRQGHLFCLSATDGKVKWHRDIKQDYNIEPPKWDFACSPYFWNEMLLLNLGKHGMAFDKKSGKTIWKSDPEETCGYASVMTYVKDNETYALVFGGEELYLVDPKTGKSLWSYPWTTKYGVNAADPIVYQEKLFISSGYDYGCALFSLQKEKPELIWKKESMKNHFSTCVLIGDYLYGIDGQAHRPKFGNLCCMSFKTGEIQWQKNLGFGSLSAANNKLIVLNSDGQLFIVEASPEGYKEYSSCNLPKLKTSVFWTMPVLCNAKIYCRGSEGELICVDVK